MEWISVSEQLPKTKTEVIVSEENGYVGMAFYLPAYNMAHHDAFEDEYEDCDEDDGNYYVPQGWYSYNLDGETFGKTATPVTHWMPKPTNANKQQPKTTEQ